MTDTADDRVLIRGGTALLGTDLTPFELGEMVLQGGEIEAISDRPSDSPGAVIDASGKVVLPGLIDAHVHLSLPGGLESLQDHLAPPVLRFLAMIRNGAIALSHGITAVRDVGACDTMAIDYAKLTERCPGIGPRVVAAGRFIVPIGGHGSPVGIEARDVGEARRAAQEQIAAGATVVKLMASGGFSSQTGPLHGGLELNQMRAIVDEAHAAGFQVSAHAHSAVGIAAALEAGVDSIEHGAYISPGEIASMIARNAVLVPTLVSMECIESGRGVPDWIVDPCIRERPAYYENVRQALLAGVAVATGTDAGSELNPHGRVVEEIEMLQRLGASPLESLLAATVAAGRLIGHDVGELRVGAAADIIIVDGDPLADVDVLRAPHRVVSRGVVVELDHVSSLAAISDHAP
jgi:imidazolonepropionase-like amidohydrolase